MLRRYCGDREREHFGESGPPHTVRSYGQDLSNTKTYQFNSLGFRGPEFDPNARMKIFVCGSSYAFGTGLNFDETWPCQFAAEYTKRFGYASHEVSLMNFAQGGASNDYIVRTALTQCGAVKPDLLVVEFVFKNRTEGFLDGVPFTIGPWLWRTGSIGRLLLSRTAPQGVRQRALRRLRAVDHYYRYYADELGFLNSLRHILLVQSFCYAKHIELIVSWSEHRELSHPKYVRNPAIAPLIPLVDLHSLCKFAIEEPPITVDRAADGQHPGPESQKIFAQALLAFYCRRVTRAIAST